MVRFQEGGQNLSGADIPQSKGSGGAGQNGSVRREGEGPDEIPNQNDVPAPSSPQSNRPIQARSGQALAVGRKGQGTDRSLMGAEYGVNVASADRPQSNNRVGTSTGQESPIRGKSHGGHLSSHVFGRHVPDKPLRARITRASQGPQVLPGGYFPQSNSLVFAGTGKGCSVRRKGHRKDVIPMSFQDSHVLAGLQIPQPNRVVPTGTCQGPPYRGKGHRRDPIGMPRQGGPVPAGFGLPEPDRAVHVATGQDSPIR